MDVTETIIAFAVKAVLDKAVGGPMPVVTGLHKTHFVLLARAIQESNRDADIQKTLEAIRKNIAEVKNVGQRLVKAIPAKPEPPSSDVADLLDPVKNKQYSKEVDDFGRGVTNVLEVLRNYVDNADDVLKRTKGELDKVEKNLNMKGAKWADMRKISNARRQEDINYIKIDDMEALSRAVGSVRSLIKAYERID